MLPIDGVIIILTLVFQTSLQSTQSSKSFNSCYSETNCLNNSIVCNNSTRLCYCLTDHSLQTTGVCLQYSNTSNSCLLYNPCVNANCLLTNGLKIKFINERLNRNSLANLANFAAIAKSLINKNKTHNNWLGVCRCENRSKESQLPNNYCNYKVIGSQCSDQSQCWHSVANSQCSASGVCVCNQTHYQLGDNCLRKKFYDQFCAESIECQPNLYCKGSQCRCKKNFDFDANSGLCQPKYGPTDPNVSSNGTNFWDHFAKIGGFVIIIVLMLFLCTKKESELKDGSITGSHRRRNSSRAHHRSSSINSHRPLTQTSSNASRSSAYRTFEETAAIRQTIIVPTPAQLIRSLSSSSEEVDYNPYQFDTLFPQQSDNDDPPSYEEVVKESGQTLGHKKH